MTESVSTSATTATAAPAVAAKKKLKRKSYGEGIAHINASFNNTIISITTTSGELLCQGSAGKAGFSGARKGTPFAAQLAAEAVAKKAIEEFSLKSVVARVSGPGAGRDSAVRALRNAGLEIKMLADVTPLPHNGCRARKRRRV